MPQIAMVWCPGQRVHKLGSCNFGTVHDKKVQFSGCSFLDGYIDLTKFKQNPQESGSKCWLISHGRPIK